MSNHLAIEFSREAAQFVLLKHRSIAEFHRLVFKDFGNAEIKQLLDRAFNEVDFLNEAMDEVTLSYSDKHSTVVPNNIFAESSAHEIFQLCFGKSHTAQNIDYNRISEIGIVNVFEIPVWVKSYFVMKFPRIVIQHEGTHMLRHALHENAFKLKSTAVIYSDFFQLSVVKHNQLEFYSFFDLQSSEDVIYHLFFVLQQKELLERGSIVLTEGVNCREGMLASIERGLKKIKELSKTTVDVSSHLMAKAQLLCV